MAKVVWGRKKSERGVGMKDGRRRLIHRRETISRISGRLEEEEERPDVIATCSSQDRISFPLKWPISVPGSKLSLISLIVTVQHLIIFFSTVDPRRFFCAVDL